MKCFKTSGNRQRKTVISEKRKQKKVCPVTSQEYCMYSFHDTTLGGENQSLLEKPKLSRQIWLFRETKAAKVPRAKYQRRESSIKRVWSSAEEPLSLHLSIDQHVYVGKPPQPGIETPEKSR